VFSVCFRKESRNMETNEEREGATYEGVSLLEFLSGSADC